MFEYHVKDNRLMTRSALLLTLASSDNKAFTFKPGQYAAISFYRNGRPTAFRNFSIVSEPSERGRLQFSIGIKGRFTSAMTRLKPGDKVKVIGPFGDFTIDEHDNRHRVMIAGGMGIAPFMSMLQSMTKRGSQANIDLLFSCRTQEHIPFADDISYLGSLNDRLKSTYFVSRGPVDKVGRLNARTGRIDESTLRKVSENSGSKEYLICGPPQFSGSMKNLLLKNGVPVENIQAESFAHGQAGEGGWFSLPRLIYTMGLSGLLLVGLYLAVKDTILQLPAPAVNTSNVNEDNTTNSRQDDLDDDATQNTTTTPTTTVTNSSSNSNSSSTNSTSPAPVCTTTQSGKTVCH